MFIILNFSDFFFLNLFFINLDKQVLTFLEKSWQIWKILAPGHPADIKLAKSAGAILWFPLLDTLLERLQCTLKEEFFADFADLDNYIGQKQRIIPEGVEKSLIREIKLPRKFLPLR